MSPSFLLLIGALSAVFASLRYAGGGARLALAALPFGVGIAASVHPAMLDLWGWAAQSGELLNVTLKLDVAGEGMKVLSAPLHIAHPLSSWLGYAWSVLGGFAMLSLWAKRVQLARISLGMWSALMIAWVIAAPAGGVLFTGDTQSGEAALRDWLMMSQSFDADRLSAFTVPTQSWKWAPYQLGLLIVAGVSALIGALLNTSDRAMNRLFEGGARVLYQLGALVALAGVILHLNQAGGFIGSATPWVALISLIVGGVLSHSASQAATLALLALAATTL